MAAFGADFPVFHEPEIPGWLAGMGINKSLLAKELENQKAAIQNKIYGVEQKYAEPNAQQALQKAILFNKYYGPEKEADISHTASLTNRTNQLLPMELLAAQLGNKQKQYDLDNPQAESQAGKQLHDLVKSGYITPERAQELSQSIASNVGTSTAGSAFKELPADYKASYLATLKAMGYNDQEAAKAAIEGKDLGDLAQAKGFERDLSDVNPKPALTGAGRTALNRSNLATAGLNAADEFINNGISHYAGQVTFNGTPAGFYADALLGRNKDKQADFIAASTLAQDQAFLRARQAGAPLSQGLLQHTLQTSLTDKRASFPFVKPDVFLEASKKIKKQFDEINKAENRASYEGTAKSNESSENQKAKREIGDTSKAYSDEDIQYTAKKYGISPDEVRKRLNKGSTR